MQFVYFLELARAYINRPIGCLHCVYIKDVYFQIMHLKVRKNNSDSMEKNLS